jgi:N-acetylglutamate synthase-like GNAT family acetyltransferase
MLLIRKAKATDAQSFFDIRNASIRNQCAGHYDDKIIALWTSGDSPSSGMSRFVEELCHVMEIDGEIVATGALNRATGQVDAIFVLPRRLRQGLASAMMAFLENEALEANLHELHLEATLNAENFYQRVGFTKIGPSQYQSPRGFSMDCVVMKKQIKEKNNLT